MTTSHFRIACALSFLLSVSIGCKDPKNAGNNGSDTRDENSGIVWEANIKSVNILDRVQINDPQSGYRLLQSRDGTESFLIVTFDIVKKEGQPGFNTKDAALFADGKKTDYVGIRTNANDAIIPMSMQLFDGASASVTLCFVVPKMHKDLSLKLGGADPLPLNEN
jgi:hypothetical protein